LAAQFLAAGALVQRAAAEILAAFLTGPLTGAASTANSWYAADAGVQRRNAYPRLTEL
jgi:hypothetical protein